MECAVERAVESVARAGQDISCTSSPKAEKSFSLALRPAPSVYPYTDFPSLRWLHRTTMRNSSPTWFIIAVCLCTMLPGLFGLAQAFLHWSSKSPVRKWRSCFSATQLSFFLLALYFSAFFVAIAFFFSSWLASDSKKYLQLLLELSCLNGHSIEVSTNLFRKETANKN